MRCRSMPKPTLHCETAAARAAARPATALAVAGVRPSKSHGQNFLVQRSVAARIVAAAQIQPGDQLIEIGPGLGILSEEMVRHPLRKLILVELDARLAAALESRFRDDARVTVANEDFIKVDLNRLAGGSSLKIIGNLPFNLAGAILERLCGYRETVSRMILMFQREVAERIRARAGARNYAALSVYTALYWQVGEHFRVAAGSFHPKPKVDAEVVVFAPHVTMPFRPEEEGGVLATIRACFSAPRKTLRNALAGGLSIELAAAQAALARAGIDPSARAARLVVDDFVRLSRVLGPAAASRRYA